MAGKHFCVPYSVFAIPYSFPLDRVLADQPIGSLRELWRAKKKTTRKRVVFQNLLDRPASNYLLAGSLPSFSRSPKVLSLIALFSFSVFSNASLILASSFSILAMFLASASP